MKRSIIPFFILAAFAAILLPACGEKPKQSKCFVEVYIPSPAYSEAVLLSTDGSVLDSTLSLANDSLRFSRTDSLNMPYVANLKLRNPSDSLDIVFMPIVIEGGTVELELSDRISLSGTPDNEKLFKFQKAKNSFMAKYDTERNPEHDVEMMKKDYSKFFADQALLYKDCVVGSYILQTYGNFISTEDKARVEERK